MTAEPEGIEAPARRSRWQRCLACLQLPKGLFPRSLLIVVLPMILLQSVVAYVFLERHWQLVTQRLSEATVRDIAAVISIIENYPQEPDYATVRRIALADFRLLIEILPERALPPPVPASLFSLLDHTLPELIRRNIGRPFWIDTTGQGEDVEIRIDIGEAVLRVVARRSQTYASNSHIFLAWMVGTAIVLLVIAILFLRNQIRPIEALATAVENFGKGRPVEDFRPRGAIEVRRAAQAFREMRRRIERHVEQRTTMLAGVSHDLRTILTRFRLELAFLGDGEETRAMRQDVDDMQEMLEGYLAFARGDGDESAAETDIELLVEEAAATARRDGAEAVASFSGDPIAVVRPGAFRRAVSNLAANAARHGRQVEINGRHAGGWITVTVEDDGPGIPAELREDAFRPFVRLDAARNQDRGGSGLGLTIARDIARGHGGEIILGDSRLGGLRAQIRVPG